MIAARDSSLGASAADSSSGLPGSTAQRRSGEVLQSFADFPLAVATEVMLALAHWLGLNNICLRHLLLDLSWCLLLNAHTLDADALRLLNLLSSIVLLNCLDRSSHSLLLGRNLGLRLLSHLCLAHCR